MKYANVMSTIAAVFALAALCLGGAAAAGLHITSKDIKNGSVKLADLHKNSVNSSRLSTDAVTTSDIDAGAVTPEDVTMPDPVQSATGEAGAKVTDAFSLVDTVSTYTKQDPSSLLEVSWTGSAESTFGACVFQLRVDGQASANGAGTVYVGGTESIAASALFSGLPAGPHTVEVFGRALSGSAESPQTCIVGPAAAGISQTFIVAEQVV